MNRKRTYADYANVGNYSNFGNLARARQARALISNLLDLPGLGARGGGPVPSSQAMVPSFTPTNSSVANSANIPVMVMKKKKKKQKKKKGPIFTKRQKASIRRMLKSSDKDLLHSKETNVMHQLSSAANKVAWDELILDSAADLETRMNYTTAYYTGATTAIGDISFSNATTSDYVGKKFYFKDSHRFKLKNNTNSAAEIVFYVLKCVDYTNFGPLLELTELRKAGFSAGAVLPKEDDFNQFWTVPRISKKERKWVIVKKYSVDLNGGEEAMIPIRYPEVVYDASVQVEMGDTTYWKGSCAVVTRIIGKPTHDAPTTGLLGFSNTLVDIYESRVEKTYMRQSNIIRAVRQNGNSGVALVTPVCADPQVPGVGAFDAT